MEEKEIESIIRSIADEEKSLLIEALRDIKHSIPSDEMRAIMAFALSQLLTLRNSVSELKSEVDELKYKYMDVCDHLNDLDLSVEEIRANIDELEEKISRLMK